MWFAITAEHVRRAIAECDELGHSDFRRKYGYGEALVYDLVYEGRRYDSKAILGVAYLLANGERPSSYSGGANTVVRRLRWLGFTGEERHVSEPLPAAGAGQLIWTREEIILAMDFYVTCGALGGRSVPGKLTSQIAGLSGLLKTLSAYPPEVQDEKYRNTNGVYQKMMNLRYVDTGGRGGLRGASQSDKAVWRDYIDNLDALHAEAAAIRLRLEEGILARPRPCPSLTTSPSRTSTPSGTCKPRLASYGKPTAPRPGLSTVTRLTWQQRESRSAGRSTGPGRSGRCSATCG